VVDIANTTIVVLMMVDAIDAATAIVAGSGLRNLTRKYLISKQ
jgi:hypothetical protein